MVCCGLHTPGIDVLASLVCLFMALGQQNFRDNFFGCYAHGSIQISFEVFHTVDTLIHDCIINILYGVMWCKEFGFNSFKISVLKGVSQSSFSLWRMHNLMGALWEHSDILWSVSHCGHFVDIDERSSKRFLHTQQKENFVNLLTNLKFGTVVSFSGQSNICLIIFDC